MAVLPTKFPCWCRAVYSWGGETDKDLGFIEGDLIECLNAGDGQWWMGRLRRDRRMIGLFPSNFVVILQDDFVPISRSVSPIPQRNDSDRKNSIEHLERKKEQAKKRRPFQGYKTVTTPVPSPTKTLSPNQLQQQASRQAQTYDPANPPSTVLWQQRPVSRGPSRGPSPMPSRSPSPMPHHEIGSSPPPPPPPHRSRAMNGEAYRARSPAPAPFDMNDRYREIARTPSPRPPSLNGHTPPMIRDAMDSVLTSLEGMSMPSEQEPELPLNPWSPEAFDNFSRPEGRPGPRPLTSLGLGPGGSTYSEEARERYSSRHNSPDRYVDGPPHLETYVQRMERQLEMRARQRQSSEDGPPPDPPPKNSPWGSNTLSNVGRRLSMKRRKSAFDLNGNLDRTYTMKTTSTNTSSGVHSMVSNFSQQSSRTGQSVFSGYSAGGFSATSAGSLARKRNGIEAGPQMIARPLTSSGLRNDRADWSSRPQTPNTGVTYHSSNDSRAGARSAVGWDERPTTSGGLGGFSTPKPKKAGFLKKVGESVKTGFASARSTIAPAGSQSGSPPKGSFGDAVTGIGGGQSFSPTRQKVRSSTNINNYGLDAAREMGLGTGAAADWMKTRRDVNRSNTPGPTERQSRAERCQMLNEPVICPADELYENVQGDEGVEGRPVYQPFQLNNPSFTQVDKAARFVTSLPSSITATSLATGYLCRPYRSDVQRLRAIFIWCAERITWEDDVELNPFGGPGDRVDTRSVIQARRGSSREVAYLVTEMCQAIGLPAQVIHGYLKRPGEFLDLDAATPSKANHYWTSVLVDGEWRIIDSSLASPTNPKRALYSSVSVSIAEAWYFLAKPSEVCWTHVPVEPSQQHLVPTISPDTLLALPGACPPFFRLGLMVHAYDTSLIRLDGLEVCTLSINVPVDVEIYAEVEANNYRQDHDGDLYEDPDSVSKMRVLSQPSWYRTSSNPDVFQKRYLIKAVLPGDQNFGCLKMYAGKKGLMHSAKDIIHALALSVPLYHSGENPPYDFFRRHPTPHATRQDLYVVQPQCLRLGSGETYVFRVRQHNASVAGGTPTTEQNGFDFQPRPLSPNPLMRPSSALSMSSSAAGGSIQGSESSNGSMGPPAAVKLKDKPAKLAIQSPGGKIIRMNRAGVLPQPAAAKDLDGETMGTIWEAGIKVTERGTWRGLVLADRSARWCVWGEWECS